MEFMVGWLCGVGLRGVGGWYVGWGREGGSLTCKIPVADGESPHPLGKGVNIGRVHDLQNGVWVRSQNI